MVKIESGTFSKGSAGSSTVILNDTTLVADLIFFWVTSAGASDTVDHLGEGFMHALGQAAFTAFGDSTSSKSSADAGKCIEHNARISGTLTEIISASKTSIGTGDFTLNFSAANSSYQIHFLAIQF